MGRRRSENGIATGDYTPKPSYYALESLIHGAWETHETFVTDGEGCLSFAGFRGDYSLKAGSGTAAFSLAEPLNEKIILS